MPRRVLILGAGLAGSRCAQTLRAEGFDGEITLVGEELHPPYERPALSKEFLAGTRSELALQPPAYWEDNDIRLLLGTRVDRIEVAQKLAWTARKRHRLGRARARHRRPAAPPSGPERPRRPRPPHARRRAKPARAAHPRPPARDRRRRLHRHRGRLHRARARTQGHARRQGAAPLRRHAGRRGRPLPRPPLPCPRRRPSARDARHPAAPRRRWCAAGESPSPTGPSSPATFSSSPPGPSPPESCSALPAGIATDEAGRTALPDVYACGDAAAPWHPALARHLRLEHWSSAVHQAATVARTILGHETTSAPSPYFWSDQFGFRLQHVGVPAGWTRVNLDAGADSLEAHYLASDDRLIAALLVNKPDAVSTLRRRLATEPLAA